MNIELNDIHILHIYIYIHIGLKTTFSIITNNQCSVFRSQTKNKKEAIWPCIITFKFRRAFPRAQNPLESQDRHKNSWSSSVVHVNCISIMVNQDVNTQLPASNKILLRKKALYSSFRSHYSDLLSGRIESNFRGFAF